jgi:hypothetical protein
MLLLTSTSDKVQLITGSAGAVKVHASWVDNASGTITPGRTNTASITTAATTDVVGAPAASTQRNVKHLNIRNTHATVANLVTVQHTDGTTVEELFVVTLAPGESITLNERGDWDYYSATGALQGGVGFADQNWGITNSIAETMDRNTCPEVNTTFGTTGQVFCQAIWLRAGQLVSNISFHSATTAAGTPTHYVFGLYDINRNLLASSADQTSTAWAANTLKTLAMGTPYRVPTTGLYYLMISVVATTVPTGKGGTAKTGAQLAGQAPIISGISSTTYSTGTAPASLGALTVGTTSLWACVS